MYKRSFKLVGMEEPIRGADNEWLRDEKGRIIYFPIGWSVQMTFLPGSDEFFEVAQHPAVFRDKNRGEAFMARVAKGSINLNNWILDNHICSPVQNDGGVGLYTVL